MLEKAAAENAVTEHLMQLEETTWQIYLQVRNANIRYQEHLLRISRETPRPSDSEPVEDPEAVRQRVLQAVRLFEDRVRAAKVDLLRREVTSKLWVLETASYLLEPMHYMGGIEGAVCIYVDAAGLVLDVQHWVGDESSVPMPIDAITENALNLGAAAIALAHNHPNDRSAPSDQDVWHAAKLAESLLTVGADLWEDYVWCHTQFRSVLSTRRFKSLSAPVGRESYGGTSPRVQGECRTGMPPKTEEA